MPRHGPAKLCPTFCMVLLESSGHCGSEMGDFPTAQDIMCTSQCKLHATVSHPNPRNQAPASSSPYRIFRLRGPLRDFMQTGRSPAAAYTQAGARNSRRSPPPVNGQRHPCDVRGIVAQQKGHLHPVHARAWSAFRSMHARIRRCAALTGHSPAPPRHESKASTLCWTTHRGRDLLRASSPPHRSTFQGEPRQWCLGNRILHVCSGGGR
jgi:hypothetical protein